MLILFNSTEHNSFPSLYPASYLSKSLASLPFGEKTSVLVKFETSHHYVQFLKSDCFLCDVTLFFWWSFFCHVSFIIIRISINIVNAGQPIFFPVLLWNLRNILKVEGHSVGSQSSTPTSPGVWVEALRTQNLSSNSNGEVSQGPHAEAAVHSRPQTQTSYHSSLCDFSSNQVKSCEKGPIQHIKVVHWGVFNNLCAPTVCQAF